MIYFRKGFWALLLSHFSCVRLCVTASHQAPPSLRFSRQEYWSGLPFPSPMHESEKWKWSRSVVSDSSRLHGLQPTRLFHPWDFPGKSTGVGCHCLLRLSSETRNKCRGWSFPFFQNDLRTIPGTCDCPHWEQTRPALPPLKLESRFVLH